MKEHQPLSFILILADSDCERFDVNLEDGNVDSSDSLIFRLDSLPHEGKCFHTLSWQESIKLVTSH